jgi:AcrR family transcriptional regulator
VPTDAPLRDDLAAAARDRILAAVGRLFERAPERDMTMDEVAAEAGVGRRTVFRHFATKDALLEAFWTRMNASLGMRVWPETEADLTALPPALFARLDAVEAVVRAAHASPAGRRMRLAANPERRAAFETSLAAATAGLDPAAARRVHAVAQLLFSATAWQTMREVWGLSGPEAGEAAAWGLRAIVAAARAEPRDPPRPEETPP